MGCGVGLALAIEPVVAQADVEVPPLAKSDGVEDVQSRVIELVSGVGVILRELLVDGAAPVTRRIR
ncbi:hypothetical protein D3C84_1032060 [compost metagenome]